MSPSSPYENLGSEAFWRTAVAGWEEADFSGLYKSKYPINPQDRIVTAGSCFAQHIGRELSKRGFTVVDAEPAPAGMTADNAKAFGYGLFSARYANIYTARQLLQLSEEAFGLRKWPVEVWERDGRYHDAQRPSVEPKGLGSAEEVALHRAAHLRRVAEAFKSADVFVFTLGLTEAWVNTRSGRVYPTAPGTIAGQYNPDEVGFVNFTYPEVMADVRAFIKMMRKSNPALRILLTVSPVPLTATAGGGHVVAATTYSKSVLRAVAGDLANGDPLIDYFPSFEIIAGTPSRGRFFESNMRSVAMAGVDRVMHEFFRSHVPDASPETATGPKVAQNRRPRRQAQTGEPARGKNDVICEEQLLEAFSK